MDLSVRFSYKIIVLVIYILMNVGIVIPYRFLLQLLRFFGPGRPWFDYLLNRKNYTSYVAALKIASYVKCSTGFLLDVGCGTGNYSVYLAQNGFNVTGIDFSQEANL